MNPLKGVKQDWTTVLGTIVFIGTIILVFLDMWLSTQKTYTFELEGWHVFSGLIMGVALIVLPQDDIKALIKKYISSKSK